MNHAVSNTEISSSQCSATPLFSSTSAGNQPTKILSSKQLAACRFSATTFQGFTGTKPVREFEAVPWGQVAHLIRPQTPAPITDKKDGQFIVPCLLKEAPLVGNTLDAAIKSGQPATGKMRSKQHVTEASLLVIDVDGLTEVDFEAGLTKLKADGLTFVAYTSHSYGRGDKPGIRARIVIALDRPIDTAAYAVAWHGLDQRYWNGQVAKADPSGANMYQQQGTWCCHPERVEQAKSWDNCAGVASADALVAIGNATSVSRGLQSNTAAKSVKDIRLFTSTNQAAESDYPDSDANKVADACQQIGAFRDAKGAGQSEPLWRDCLGVVGRCIDGKTLVQEWSSGHKDYDEQKTADKLDYRLKTAPTTCAQFQKSNTVGCKGCAQQCKSPITLGWPGAGGAKFQIIKVDGVVKADKTAVTSQEKIATSVSTSIPSSKAGAVIESLPKDGVVKSVRKQSALPFSEFEPYPEQVAPSLVLNEIAEILPRYVVLDTAQVDAAVLWIAHTYFLDAVDTSPLAIINAPEKACAKTLFQTVLASMSYRSLPAANASPSALFRSVGGWRPTLFFDEADTFFRDNIELQGMVNAGYKRGGFVLRSEATGNDFVPKQFSVYSAKSIAGIALEKHLPDSTMSRGVIFNLRRKLPHESVSRLRYADPEQFALIASKLVRFAADYTEQVRQARPALPDELNDRAQDNWEPLLAIAELAGPDWLQRATSAALILSNTGEDSVSTGNELLADIKEVFERACVDKISSAELILELCKIDDGAWATYNRGQQISPRQLAKQLAAYGIKSKTVRLGRANTPKGYDAAQFDDAFARYLGAPKKLPPRCNDAPEPNSGMAEDVADKTQQCSHESVTFDTLLTQVGCGVADVAAGAGEAFDRPEEAF